MTLHTRATDREAGREPQQCSVWPRLEISISGWSGRDLTKSGRQAEPEFEFATRLRNHFCDDASNTLESHRQPDGLIAFLMPKSMSFRVALGAGRTQPGRAVPEPPSRPDCGPGKRSLLRSAVDHAAGARDASERPRSHSPDWLFRVPPGGVSNERRAGPAVAIPSSRIRGFFPLTDVCAKRENSVPTCKTGICVPSSNWFAAPGLLRMAGP